MTSKYIETRHVLGKGAFGKVVQVFSYETGFPYAKKICTREGHYLDNTETEKWIMETLASGNRAHEGFNHIVHLVDSERNPQTGGVDLIMQLYQGTLLELMEAQHVLSDPSDPDSELILNPLPEVVVKDITQQVSLGLAYMNTLGWSHCDLKPENILWKRNVFTKSGYHFSIADFGNAVKKMSYFNRIQTQQYMCTENLLGIASVKNCDMPSLACVLYECVAGEFLTNHRDKDEHIMAHLNAIGKETLSQFRLDEIPAIWPYYKRISTRWGYLENEQFPLQQAMVRGGYIHKKALTDLIAFMLIPFPDQRISAQDVCKHKLFYYENMVKKQNDSRPLIDTSEEEKAEEEETQLNDEVGEVGEVGEVDETDFLKKVEMRKRKRSKQSKRKNKKWQKK